MLWFFLLFSVLSGVTMSRTPVWNARIIEHLTKTFWNACSELTFCHPAGDIVFCQWDFVPPAVQQLLTLDAIYVLDEWGSALYACDHSGISGSCYGLWRQLARSEMCYTWDDLDMIVAESCLENEQGEKKEDVHWVIPSGEFPLPPVIPHTLAPRSQLFDELPSWYGYDIDGFRHGVIQGLEPDYTEPLSYFQRKWKKFKDVFIKWRTLAELKAIYLFNALFLGTSKNGYSSILVYNRPTYGFWTGQDWVVHFNGYFHRIARTDNRGMHVALEIFSRAAKKLGKTKDWQSSLAVETIKHFLSVPPKNSVAWPVSFDLHSIDHPHEMQRVRLQEGWPRSKLAGTDLTGDYSILQPLWNGTLPPDTPDIQVYHAQPLYMEPFHYFNRSRALRAKSILYAYLESVPFEVEKLSQSLPLGADKERPDNLSEHLHNQDGQPVYRQFPLIQSRPDYGSIFLVPPTGGFTFVTDIDDILRVGKTWSPSKSIEFAFFRHFEPWLNMPEVFHHWLEKYGAGRTHFHYSTLTPEQLAWQYETFLAQWFPRGSFDSRAQGLLHHWTGAEEARRKSTETVVKRFPGRKFVLIGDTVTAELMKIYSELLKLDNVVCVLIRNVAVTERTLKNFPAFELFTQQKHLRHKYFFFNTPDDIRDLDFAAGQCINETVNEIVWGKRQSWLLTSASWAYWMVRCSYDSKSADCTDVPYIPAEGA